MTTFGKNFFPSNDSVCADLINGLELEGKHVADSSAGDGAILEFIQQRYDGHRVKEQPYLYAVENEPDLCAILESKGFPVMWNNFLTWKPTVKLDFIIQNPPFDRAAEFILHAWEILEDGVISSILPASILKENDSYEKAAMELIRRHGTVKNIGRPFARNSERTTQEECILVRITKVGITEELVHEVKNDYDEVERLDGLDAPEDPGNAMLPPGLVYQLEVHQKVALDAFADYRKAYANLLKAIAPFNGNLVETAQLEGKAKDAYNKYAAIIRAECWDKVFDNPSFRKHLTSRAQTMLKNFHTARRRVDFNSTNVESALRTLMANSPEFMKQCVDDAFAAMTEHYWGNCVKVMGWKSNKSYIASTRVVLPGVLPESARIYKYIHHDEKVMLDDIDRALCLIEGIEFDSIRHIVDALEEQMKSAPYQQLCYSKFFKIRFYYGIRTIHLYFLDTGVWQRFNYAAAKSRGWLPDDAEPKHLKIRRRKAAEKMEIQKENAKHDRWGERRDDVYIAEYTGPMLPAGSPVLVDEDDLKSASKKLASLL